jgi:hypothetical protein
MNYLFCSITYITLKSINNIYLIDKEEKIKEEKIKEEKTRRKRLSGRHLFSLKHISIWLLF